jgi:PST family polysaccharide transporter
MTGDQPQREELRAAAVRGIRWASISRPATEVIQLVSLVILARLISPAEFGRYAIALIAQEVAFIIISEGVSSALVQRKYVDREHLQTGVALGLLMGLGLTVMTLVASSLIVAPIFGARTALFVRLISPLGLVSAATTVPMATLRRRMEFRRLSEIEVLSTLVRVAVCVALALAGLGGEALVLGLLANALVIALVACISAPPPLPRLHLQAARELLAYGLPASMAAVSWVGFNNVDYAIIGARLNAFQTGLYFRAYTLAIEYQKKVSVVMGQVGFPVLSRTRDADELTEMHRQMVRLLTIMLFPLLVLLAIEAPVLVPFLLGSAWSEATVPVQILALGGAATLVIDAAGTVLMATGRTRALLGYGIAHFLAYGLAVYAVVPYGIVAVAVAAAVVHTLFLIVAYALLLRGSPEHTLRRLWSDIAPATVSCLGLAAVVVPANFALSAAHVPAIVQLTVVGLIAAPPYLLTLRVCFPEISRRQRLIVVRLLPNRRQLRWAKRRLELQGAQSSA